MVGVLYRDGAVFEGPVGEALGTGALGDTNGVLCGSALRVQPKHRLRAVQDEHLRFIHRGLRPARQHVHRYLSAWDHASTPIDFMNSACVALWRAWQTSHRSSSSSP